MSAELRTLITKRASIRGRLTKFEIYLDLTQKIPTLSELQVNEISLKLQSFHDLKTEFSLLQDQIDQINFESIEDEVDERDKTDSQFTKVIALAETIVDKYKTKQKQSESGSGSFRSDHQPHHQPNFKLPQIQIAKFNGNYSKWLDFRDTYVSLIHDNDRLLPVHKFHYLNSYLEGEAARVLSNLEVSNAHYQEAWDLLCQRYDNKRYLTNNHLNSLFNIEQVQRESDKSLRSLVDQVNKDLRALSSLGHPTHQWDTLIIHIITNKLDYHTKRDWEEHRNTINDMPSLSQLTKFLHDRADVLESCHTKKQYNNTNYHAINNTTRNERSYKSFSCTTQNNNDNGAKIQTPWVCNYCSGDHSIYNCSKFLLLSVEQRKMEVMKLKLCLNCLKKGHSLRECRRGPCRECRKRHNSLLHIPLSQPGGSSISAQPALTADDNTPTQDVSVNFSASQTAYQVLLSTATIKVTNPLNKKQSTVRCLLDSGSQGTFMTKALQQKLELESIPTVPIKIMGVANIPCGSISERSVVRLNSLCTDYNVTQACGVLPELTDNVPKQFIDKRYFNLPPKLQLADPTFNISAPVEMLIGADLFWQIVGNEQWCLGANLPYLRSSQLGWLISGPMFSNSEPRSIKCNFSRTDTSENLNEKISRFWELEELPKRPLLSSSEKECELHYNTHTSRQEDGRFVVKLPFKDSPDNLGDSYYRARQRFLSLERKFRKEPELKKAYSEFIAEYGELGHCSPVEGRPPEVRCHYLCHHAVLRAQSESTKLRVVFDGSAPTSTGVSINDIQHTGPKVQDSLFAILLRFRTHKYVLAGDIDKFFRQVVVHEEDRDLQLILWREDEKQQLKTIRLNTVTYGFASASYLSTKCLWTLGEKCQDETIKQIIQKDFYCDDMLTGSNTKADLLHILNAVTTHLKSGCFNLRKFKSNTPDIFPISTVNLQGKLSLSDASNALGLGWSPQSDELYFTIEAPTSGMQEKITKRTILSSTFSIYDPLGLLSPCTVQPKLLMQQLWRRGLDWDEPVPDDLQKEWKKITASLPSLANITIPRRALSGDPIEMQLHSFCDASMHAYGACIYLRCKDKESNISVNLLCAKSRVAPTKPPLTIPKLELLGALLAANLTKSVLESLRCSISSCTHWCDSNVVIAWLHSSPSKLKSFVANKVVEICSHTCVSAWRHVPGAANPADVLSRGAPADQLAANELWWRGPAFLAADDSQWPQAPSETKKLDDGNLPEIIVLPSTSSDCDDLSISFENFSTLGKLQRTYAYVLRLKHNLKNKNNKLSGPLSVQEINDSFLFLAMRAQKQSFTKEYHALSTKQDIASKSNILSLNPFLNKEGVMRVGGRLNRSTYSHEKKHPIILDSTHHFTKLIFQHEHIRLMHAGPQHLLYSIRDSIWPVCGRKLARTTVHRCVTCRRHRGQTLTPMMGNLPPQRVTPALPFQTIGMDFAGPFNIASKKGRGARLSKCYLCLFICQAYKCVHLEAVSELSKDAFLLSLRRFISRRGKPLEIFSDNGRNFTAASKEVGQFLKTNSNAISDLATNLHIKFNFHPPYAPHFSGLAEAGIKSAKHHIKRVMGNSNLTFEELSTLFTQVEGIMNSRPLSPLSSHPTDYLPLSPAHFIIGRPLTSVRTPAIDDTRPSRSRYETIERMRQLFWRRWQHEYISELQQRTKWKRNKNTLQVNDMVLIQEDNVPPLNWRLGRIEKLIPGKDGISRVADIRTARGTIRRALTRLCPLPNEN